MKLRSIILFTLFIGITKFALASELRVTTDLIDANISGPDVYNRQYDGKSFWLFTAPDSNGINQVFYQWSDASTTSTSTSPKVQLTFNTFHATKAKFGSEVNDLHYAATSADTPSVCEGVVFYYLADSDSDSSKDIRMGCIAYPNMATDPTTVNFDVKLTGYDSATNFDVKDYDVSRAGRATTLNIYSTAAVQSYPVVFTDTSNTLHMLMFRKDIIYGNSDNITGATPPILYDYSDPWSYVYIWNATTINSGAEYFTPALDPWANNIVFSIKTSAGSYKQLGTINISGRGLSTITNFRSNVINPKYHGDFHPASNLSTRFGLDVFFEIRDSVTSNTRLAYLPVAYFFMGTTSWCNTAAYLTDETYSRTDLRTDFGTNTSTTPSTLLLYKQQMPDGKHDLYVSEVDVSISSTGLYCNGVNTRPDGTIMHFVSTPTRGFYDLSKIPSKQLTCMENNTSASFLQTIYHDASFTETVPSSNLMDVVFQRDYSDGSGEVIGHIYAIEETKTTEECTDNCFETPDGSPVIDINLFRDGDGLADHCEDPTCQQLVNVDLYGDADADTVANNRDNCPCDSNTDQADADSDHWGDVCDIEYDECGTTDTDSDGVGDICDACPEHAELAELAYDNDGNGVMDSCVSTNPCGTVDTDQDGTFDMCDACPSDASLTALAYDIDGDGTMDSCVSTPCGTADADGDGVFDNCDACPNDPETSTLTFDVNADGLIDSCATAATSTETPDVEVQEDIIPPSGGFLVEGTVFSCTLNTQAEWPATVQTGLWLCVLSLTALLTKARQQAKR